MQMYTTMAKGHFCLTNDKQHLSSITLSNQFSYYFICQTDERRLLAFEYFAIFSYGE